MNAEHLHQVPLGAQPELKQILEALLLAAGEPLSLQRMASVFQEKDMPSTAELSAALNELASDLDGRGIELKQVASGYRLQTRQALAPWISRLWEERPQRYSRALLETLALVAYRQPITRGEIEEVRGVSVSSNIIRTLQEREWIRVVGHRDVPGKPALFGTTKAFLDYFDLVSLDDLPTLAEIRDMSQIEPELEFEALEPAQERDQEPEHDPEQEPATAGEQNPAEQLTPGADLAGDEATDPEASKAADADIDADADQPREAVSP